VQGEYEEELKHLLNPKQPIIQLTGNCFVLRRCPVYFLSSKKRLLESPSAKAVATIFGTKPLY